MRLKHPNWQIEYEWKNKNPVWQATEAVQNIRVPPKHRENVSSRDNRYEIYNFACKFLSFSLLLSAPSRGEHKASSHHNYGMLIRNKMCKTLLRSDNIFHGDTVVTMSQNIQNTSSTNIWLHVCPAYVVLKIPLIWNSCHTACIDTMHHLGDIWYAPWGLLLSLGPCHTCHTQIFCFDVQWHAYPSYTLSRLCKGTIYTWGSSPGALLRHVCPDHCGYYMPCHSGYNSTGIHADERPSCVQTIDAQ